MTLPRLPRLLAALVASIVCLFPLGVVHAQTPGAGNIEGWSPLTGRYEQPSGARYVEVSVGVNRAPDGVLSGIGDGTSYAWPADGAVAPVAGVAFGRAVSPNVRIEGELTYLQLRWDVATTPSDDLELDAFNFSANVFYDIPAPTSLSKLEVGLGAGWASLDEGCVRHDSSTFCVDENDWTLKAMVGGSYGVSRNGALVARYSMVHYGKLDSDNRYHVFTVGYRRYF